MNLIDRALARAMGTRKAAEPVVPGRLRADTFYDPPSEIKAEQRVALYTKLSWIQVAVSIASQTCAATPYHVRRGRGEMQDIPDHPFLDLLARPNPTQSRFEFLEATFSWRRAAGNCYWWLNRPNADTPPAEAWIIPAPRIRPVPDGAMGVRGYLYDTGSGQPMPLEPWEIIHFKTFNPLDRYVGLSPIEALALDAMGDLASQQFNANFYSRDNAKGAGFLAFKDYIDEDRWRQLKTDYREQHGGTQNNRMMLLRGVGDGVSWIPTQLSQVEIQYLEQRTFTKEQVYDMFAPGLSSILSVNATEANSTAGKDTFLSMCVYPQHVAVAEKIDGDLLPVYGDDLDGEFDDVRRVDTTLELAMQTAYERTHTIDETRKRYYNEGPIGDERGKLRPGDAAPRPPAPPAEPPPAEAIAEAGKALDRRRWQTKAIKAFAAGRAIDVPFDPDYLTDDEAMQIRAALKRAQTADDLVAVFRGAL